MRKIHLLLLVIMLTLYAVSYAEENPENDSWFYYGGDSLCKIGEGANAPIKLSDDRSVHIVGVQNGWIYYTCENGFNLRNYYENINPPYIFAPDTELVKIRTDGSGRTRLYHYYSTQ